jgi:hypothetical protein
LNLSLIIESHKYKREVLKMKYTTGEEVNVGDRVIIEKGKTLGIVHTVIETLTQMQECGVDEPGILIKSAPFGLVFWSCTEIEDPVIFKGRPMHQDNSFLVM